MNSKHGKGGGYVKENGIGRVSCRGDSDRVLEEEAGIGRGLFTGDRDREGYTWLYMRQR